ncbi:MAG: transposase [Candidatus Lokiarchaeota archaeon]|nr:transposase [Candidatus Lokiarchaeota archaeon]
MFLTRKVCVCPSSEQKQILWDLSEKCRLLYNFSLQERKEDWRRQQFKTRDERKYITYQQQSKALPLIKQKYTEYRRVYSKVLQQVLKKLDENYRSFFTKFTHGDENARPPRFKGKQHFFTLCYNQSGFKIMKNCLLLSHNHPSKTPLIFTLPIPFNEDLYIKQVEIKRDTQDRWFACIIFEIEPPPYHDNGLYQAIDLGISNLVSAVNLQFKFIQVKNRRADLYWKKKLEVVQSRRDHCKKRSQRWEFYNDKFLRMKHKCVNQLRDFQHKISHQIVMNTRANTIIIGDLNVKQMAKKRKGTGNGRKTKARKTLNHSMQNTGSLGRFAQFLTYKAEMVGKRIIRIDESYTSQECCICQKRVKRMLSERYIRCDCGHRMDRDLNSAVNIMERFLMNKSQFEFLSQEPSVTEESFRKRLDSLRHTAPSLPLAEDGGLVVSG